MVNNLHETISTDARIDIAFLIGDLGVIDVFL